MANVDQNSISVLFSYSQRPYTIIMFPSKQGPLPFKTRQSTSLKGFPTSSLCKFLSVVHLVAAPQNALSISISRICSHSCPNLGAFVLG